jgi:anaerobic magnesium-protoporphyrin IX monomethyl ester cyclase
MHVNELFLFVRPPRPMWPFNGPSSAFWPPLAFASLAAALREKIGDLRVAILDAPALQMGWRSLEAELQRLQPAYVGLGEEAVSCVEGLRLAADAHRCGARVIAGGCFFGQVAPEVLGTGLVDVVVHGEGELTLVELVQALRSGNPADLRAVAGISYAQEGEVIQTEPRGLLGDLDELPFPAYDLLPVERYGDRSRNHPRLAAIELGRGCRGSCDYCVLWRQMGEARPSGLVPKLRTKSPARLLEEIRLLVRRYDRRYLGWVDPCFNADPQVPAQLAELLLKEPIQVGQSAWVRADNLVRDGRTGALAALTRAGLNEVYLGIERADQASLHDLKRSMSLDQVREALGLLARDYPQVLTVGSFIYGLPGDTPASVRAIHHLSVELELDKVFYIPFTPLPGTPYWNASLWDPTGQEFRRFNFLPGNRDKSGGSSLERALMAAFLLDWSVARIRILLRGLFSRDERKRRINWHLFIRSVRFIWDRLSPSLCSIRLKDPLIYPRWYES